MAIPLMLRLRTRGWTLSAIRSHPEWPHLLASAAERSRSFSAMRRPYRARFIHRHTRTLLYMMYLRDWDANLERDLADSGIVLTHNVVDQVMECIPSPRLALQFFIWAGEQIGYPPATSKATFDVSELYGHKSKILPFLSILRSLSRPQCFLSPSKLNVLLQGYGWAGMLDRSYTILSNAKGFLNAFLVNCFLSSIMKERRYDMVYQVYSEMKKCGTPVHVCLDPLICGMSRAADGAHWREASDLFDQMVRLRQVPTADACNALTVAVSNAKDHEKAFELFCYMKDHGIAPDKLAFSAIVECLSLCKQLPRASMLLEEAKKYGYNVDAKVYKTLLGAI